MRMDTEPQSPSPSSLSQADIEEDYIDMEVSSSPSSLHCLSQASSSPQSREFEFQATTALSNNNHDDTDTSPSPADELFYNGKLLPLYLPRRLQMVEKLLNENKTHAANKFFTAPCTTNTTPLESRNVSPSESCRVSCELNPHDYNYFFHWSTDMSMMSSSSCSFTSQQFPQATKKCWSKRLKLIKQFTISQKLKASRSYLKSLFGKPTCTTDVRVGNSSSSIGSDLLKDDYVKVTKLTSIFDKKDFSKCTIGSAASSTSTTPHRRSFSGAIKRRCTAKCMSSSSTSDCSSSSSSFSLKAGGFYELNLVNGGGGGLGPERDNAIEGAIAHCKKSQQQQCDDARKVDSDIGLSLLLKQKVAGCGDNGRAELCRI